MSLLEQPSSSFGKSHLSVDLVLYALQLNPTPPHDNSYDLSQLKLYTLLLAPPASLIFLSPKNPNKRKIQGQPQKKKDNNLKPYIYKEMK